MIKSIVKSGEYYDSVSLMIVGKKINEELGISDAAVVMGTDENKVILKMSDLYLPEFEKCTDTDLIIVVKHPSEEKIKEVLPKIEDFLYEIRNKTSDTKGFAPKSLEGAIKYNPNANLVLISVAGKYAGDIAFDALKNDLHVMLFSDNVPIETEHQLKKYAVEKNLLMMGPDCGTAIINGVALAFANLVNRGNIGIISASGTGLQEVSSIISDAGFGISQAIGTGGRDLKKEIGGLMFISALKALKDDENTDLIVLISKPPHPDVLKTISKELKNIGKEIVTVFLGADDDSLSDFKGIKAKTLEEAALKAISAISEVDYKTIKTAFSEDYEPIDRLAEKAKKQIGDRGYIRGLYSGGTLCDEAQIVLSDYVDEIYTNRPLGDSKRLQNSWKSHKHTLVDLGEDEFTVGRLHPMIDFTLRNQRMILEAEDRETAVILFDLVIGYGANQNPLDDLLPTIEKIKQISDNRVALVCSVTGTEMDPQNKVMIIETLKNAGVFVLPSNAQAAELAGKIIQKK